MKVVLPAGLSHAGYLSAWCEFTEANSTNTKFSDEASWAATKWTPVIFTYTKFWLALWFCNDRFFSQTDLQILSI